MGSFSYLKKLCTSVDLQVDLDVQTGGFVSVSKISACQNVYTKTGIQSISVPTFPSRTEATSINEQENKRQERDIL